MPSNPMQRKVRNSFLLGVLVMLVIAILIGAIVYLVVIKPQADKKKADTTQYDYVYRLKSGKSVNSGEEITGSMVEAVEIPVTTNNTDFIRAKRTDQTGKLVDVAFTSGYKSKVALKEGTILTKSMLMSTEDEDIENSLRYMEYNMITMPTTLEEGDYIDIRLRLPNSQDLIVISKKSIVSIYNQTVGFNLTEDEILLLNSAIVESYKMTSSELYLAKYVEPGMQEKSVYTYSPSEEVVNLIQSNPNIVATARESIANKFRKY
jgi:preprotein translocase subunit YajC